jgi:hypothetical protein
MPLRSWGRVIFTQVKVSRQQGQTPGPQAGVDFNARFVDEFHWR